MPEKYYFSSKALIMNEDHFLALYKMKNGTKWWDLPGGRMESGETAEETLKREVFEELGLEIEPVKLIDTWIYKHVENFEIVGVVYYTEVVKGDLSLSDEHDGYAWISKEEIGEVFTRKAFVERMKDWNWDLIQDKNIKFR